MQYWNLLENSKEIGLLVLKLFHFEFSVVWHIFLWENGIWNFFTNTTVYSNISKFMKIYVQEDEILNKIVTKF